MIWKNLFRRKGRTFLTLAGIALGVAAIIALGALASGMRAGYTSIAGGSEADLILSQASAMDITMGGVEEEVGAELASYPEVAAVDGMLMGNVQAEGSAYFFVFGYDPAGFAIGHYRIVEGQSLAEAQRVRGKPLLLGRAAAQGMGKTVGDTLRLTGGTFRIVGIYETGDGLEDGGAVISLDEAQSLLLQPRRVSMYYLRLRSPEDDVRLRQRVERSFDDLILSATNEFADRQEMILYTEAFGWGIAVLAILIGGVGMTNALFMSVFERTREIGLLRAVGWRRGQVLALVLGESLALSLLGGALGSALGVVAASALRGSTGFLGMMGSHFTPGLFVQALVTVLVLGLVGGAYPAWWASRLLPLEALRYEGGGGGGASPRLPGATLRNLWRRRTRTALTLLGIAVAIAAIVALTGLVDGFTDDLTAMARGSNVDLMALERDASDTGYSTIDERVGARLEAMPGVEGVAGIGFAFASTPKTPLLFLMGYNPREFGIEHFRIVEGRPLETNRQIILGRQAAETLEVGVGDTLRLLESTFRVVGIYETGVSWEEGSAVVSLRDAQRLAGRPHQVSMYGIRLRDPEQSEAVRDELNATVDEVDVSLTAEFAENLPDMQASQGLLDNISFLAVLIGGLGMLNTMLMSVLERTREIGVLRALGWRRRQVVGMILQEALALGLAGGLLGLLLGTGLAWAITLAPAVGSMMAPQYSPVLMARVLAIALGMGIAGGLYPAWRATRMSPVEALRYE
ncbi:MAG: ABC transporter permease [Anaerolineae bacterium]|jgi:ABC-type antimicrobial peptide transport system permease subunit|nr:ABC transporter permease [Anaerolineae bacterium]